MRAKSCSRNEATILINQNRMYVMVQRHLPACPCSWMGDSCNERCIGFGGFECFTIMMRRRLISHILCKPFRAIDLIATHWWFCESMFAM